MPRPTTSALSDGDRARVRDVLRLVHLLHRPTAPAARGVPALRSGAAALLGLTRQRFWRLVGDDTPEAEWPPRGSKPWTRLIEGGAAVVCCTGVDGDASELARLSELLTALDAPRFREAAHVHRHRPDSRRYMTPMIEPGARFAPFLSIDGRPMLALVDPTRTLVQLVAVEAWKGLPIDVPARRGQVATATSPAMRPAPWREVLPEYGVSLLPRGVHEAPWWNANRDTDTLLAIDDTGRLVSMTTVQRRGLTWAAAERSRADAVELLQLALAAHESAASNVEAPLSTKRSHEAPEPWFPGKDERDDRDDGEPREAWKGPSA